MRKHDDSESNYLSDLGPHIGSAYYLSKQEEKEKLCHLGV
jgi:hypothetical protein